MTSSEQFLHSKAQRGAELTEQGLSAMNRGLGDLLNNDYRETPREPNLQDVRAAYESFFDLDDLTEVVGISG